MLYFAEVRSMVKLQLDNYLKAEDFPKSGIMKVKFEDEGVIGKQVFDGKETENFTITVALINGDERKWTMNKTSQRAVAEHYGDDSATWVGEAIEIFLMDTNVAGKIKKAIYARGKQ